MLRGLYTSAIGMRTQMNKMDILANNLANADTTGFKKDSVATQSFTEELMKRIHDPLGQSVKHERNIGMFTSGLSVDEVYTDFTNGRITHTGGPLDLSINGNGFFAVNVTDAAGNVTEKYTRDGAFTLDSQGVLYSKDGGQVLGQNGPITIPNGEITVSSTGDIIVNGAIVDTLSLVSFENLESLRKYGTNYYDVTEESQQIPFNGILVQGYLENSNVNSVMEMVEIINTSRIYEANQRMVTFMDTILGKAVNDIARK